MGAESHLGSGERLGCEPGGRLCGAEKGLRLVWAGGACSQSIWNPRRELRGSRETGSEDREVAPGVRDCVEGGGEWSLVV